MPMPVMALTYAAKDADDFAKALQDQKETGFYTDVETRVLTDRDGNPSKHHRRTAWLEKMATNPNDVSVLFLAGHGLTDDKQTYWFYPADANADDVRAKGVSQDELRQSLQSLSGQGAVVPRHLPRRQRGQTPAARHQLLVNKVIGGGERRHRGIRVFDRTASVGGARRLAQRRLHQGGG